MSIERGRAYFRQFGMEDRVIEFTVSSATVELAAKALGVEGARIAKTLSFKKPEGGALLILIGVMTFTGWMNGVTGYLSSFGAPSVPSRPESPRCS